MEVHARAKVVGVAVWRATCRRVGTRRLVRLLRGGTTAADRRELLATLLNDEPMVVEFERDGRRWCAPTGDEIFTELFWSGGYQTGDVVAVDDWVAQQLARGGRDVVIDVGANIGTTTCPLADRGRRVIAIEPVPDTYALLERNVRMQRLDELVTTVNSAVATVAGSLEMVTTAGSGSNEVALPGETPAFAQWGMKATGAVTVPARRLDQIVRELGTSPDDVRFVWSDTQGYEGDVIESGSGLWSSGVPLYLEIWPEALDRRYHLDQFTMLVRSTFASFVSRDELGAGSRAERRPISEFGTFVEGVERWTDALLIP